VIGTRGNIERLARDDLMGWVQRQYTGANVVLAVAGAVDPEMVAAEAHAAFGALLAGSANRVAVPVYAGGVRTRAQAGSSQTHLVLGFPLPSRADDDPAGEVAASLFGEGMSSPLLDQIREQRGLVYHAACSADVIDVCGQFVIEASTGPEQLDELLNEVMRLLAAQAETVDAVDLERAQHQIAVRSWRAQEHPVRRLEGAVLDLFALGRVRTPEEGRHRMEAVSADEVSAVFRRVLAGGASLALAGKLPRGAGAMAREILATHAVRSAATL
jgi:predicted Zn-dependent peptidase